MFHKIQATGALLFVSCIALWGLAPHSILFLDDQAFSMQLGKLILDGISPLTGRPSHLGARHIGPLYIWFIGGVLFLA